MAPKRKAIDYDIVRKLASIGCTDREIAAVVELTPEHFCRRQKKDPHLRPAIEAGRETGKASLRRMQWEKAKSGNPALLIWLGKQLLGQRDRHELGGDPERPLHGDKTVRQLTYEELEAIAARGLAKTEEPRRDDDNESDDEEEK